MCNAANLRFLSYRVHADSLAVIGSSSKHNICTLSVPNDVLHHAIYTLQSVQHKFIHAIINHQCKQNSLPALLQATCIFF